MTGNNEKEMTEYIPGTYIPGTPYLISSEVQMRESAFRVLPVAL